jgi:hypothetical protein
MLYVPTRPIERFDQALAAMRGGATLQFGGDPLWALTDGTTVNAEIATLLLISGAVEPTGHLGSPGMAAPGWRLKAAG